MIKYNDLTEEFLFPVDLLQVFGVFLAEHKAGTGIYAKSDLRFEVVQYKISDGGEKVRVVIIIPVDPVAFVILFDKAERADGIDIIIAVKFLRAAVLLNEFIDKYG